MNAPARLADTFPNFHLHAIFYSAHHEQEYFFILGLQDVLTALLRSENIVVAKSLDRSVKHNNLEKKNLSLLLFTFSTSWKAFSAGFQ